MIIKTNCEACMRKRCICYSITPPSRPSLNISSLGNKRRESAALCQRKE